MCDATLGITGCFAHLFLAIGYNCPFYTYNQRNLAIVNAGKDIMLILFSVYTILVQFKKKSQAQGCNYLRSKVTDYKERARDGIFVGLCILVFFVAVVVAVGILESGFNTTF